MINHKTLSAEDKFSLLMKKALNPFIDPNFNELQLRRATHPDMDESKKIEVPDPRETRSVLRLNRKGTEFKPEAKDQVVGLIAGLRDRLDVPFDELYHKEKSLV